MSPAARGPWETLLARRTLGVCMGLEIVEAVFEALGSPGREIPAVHVVGTNGKGSTAAMIEHALLGRKMRTGLYTSPHLHRLGERVRVGGQAVADEELCEHVAAVLGAEQGLALPRPLSFFELLTLAALHLMATAAVEVRIVEAGLGARHDATRVIAASVVGITSISVDHQASLGPTLIDIAREKAGAMRPGARAFTAPQAPEVLAVLQAEAAKLGCALAVVEPRPRPPLGLRGDHQRHNAAVALAVGRAFVSDLVGADLDGVFVPGRLERLPHGGGELWLDVAHNPDGIAAVVAAIRSRAVPMPSLVVFGCNADKDASAMIEGLRSLGVPLWWVPLGGAASPRLAERSFAGIDDPELQLALAAELAEGGCVLTCGSHVLVGAIRANTAGDSSPADPQDPRPRGP